MKTQLSLLLIAASAHLHAADITVDFAAKLQPWHGFGVNYVETAQTRDYDKWPQDFGGFSKLTEAQRHELMDALYGPDGLGLALHKIFLDPWAQATPDALTPLLPRPKGDKNAEGMKKQIPSSKCPKFEPPT